MGSSLTIDKHTTSLQDWLQLNPKLQDSPYQQPPNNHISVWKFFLDDLNPNQFNCLPLDLNLAATHQLLSPHQTYLVLAVKTSAQNTTSNNSYLNNVINATKHNIEESSYQTHLLHGCVQSVSYQVYCFCGKLSKNKIRMACISYVYKLKQLLNSKKKLAILSSGGVLRNKKLQKGSVLPLVPQSTLQKQLNQYQPISVFSFYLSNPPTNKLLSLRPKRNPFVQCQQKQTPKTNKPAGIKPPLLKLALKPFEQVSYAAIQQQQKNGQIKFDIRATARHELKMEKFQSECSEIIQGVFVSGQKMAKSWESLKNYQIKAIINCAGDYCENWFQNKGITYLTFFLKDSQNQNIQCLFYRVIEFVQQCQNNKTNILIHCIQGISRSITFAIAYVIFKFGYDYKKAQQFVKQKRGIACPNNGFMVELIQFHKRLYEAWDSLPQPRIFLVSAHSKQTPQIITARLIKQALFDKRKYMGLDSRGVYIIQAHQIVYIWVGTKCQQKRLKDYWNYAQQYVKKLQKYQRASNKVKAISQGTQGKQFYSLWNLDECPPAYQNPDYSRLFVQGIQPTRPGGMRKLYQRQIQQQQSQNKVFIYPQYKQGLGVFQFQDLVGLSLVVNIDRDSLKIYICRQHTFRQNDQVIGSFLDNVIRTNYASYEPDQIIIEEESLSQPSEALMMCFS